MRERQKDMLADVGGRLDALRRRVADGSHNMSGFDVEALETAGALVNTLVLWADGPGLDDKLLTALEHQIDAVRRKFDIDPSGG